MQNVSLTDKVRTLTHRLSNKKGHRFLYGDFENLVEYLKQANSLSKETIDAIRECVNALIWEADVFQYYQSWAIRCNQCASILVGFLPYKESLEEKIERQQDTFTDSFIWSFLNFSTFNDYCERLSTRPERARKVACLCFEHSDTGRRPHLMEDEEVFYTLFIKGYNLAVKYIESTRNYEAFSEWFNVLDPFHIGQITESIECYDRVNQHLYNMIEDTLIKQLKLLEKWLKADALSFINYWKSKRIIELLEFVDDNVFFDTLQTLANVKSNPEVHAVIEYYTHDEESHILRFAQNLLADYEKD